MSDWNLINLCYRVTLKNIYKTKDKIKTYKLSAICFDFYVCKNRIFTESDPKQFNLTGKITTMISQKQLHRAIKNHVNINFSRIL